MNGPDVNVSYHDLSSLQDLRAMAKKDEKSAIRQAAQQFESVFMGMLLSSMRKANKSFEQDNPLNSQASEFYRDMNDSQLSTELSKSGALGLADLMVQQLAPQQSKTKTLAPKLMPAQFAQQQAAMPLHKKVELLYQKPDHGSQFRQLDAERIIYPAPKTTSRDQAGLSNLQPAATLSLAQPVGGQAAVMHLGAEAVVQEKSLRQLRHTATVTTAAAVKVVTETSAPLQAMDKTQAGLVDTGPLQFVQKLWPAAKLAAGQLGLEPLALIAQAALETGWGQKMIKQTSGAHSNNLFGIKAQSGWSGQIAVVDSLEYRQGVAQREKSKFRAYDSIEQSLQDYVDFVKENPRYQAAVAVAHDTKAYFSQLQAAGYATDPNYASKIHAVLQSTTMKEVRKLLENAG